jgi:4-carboxymuconolactone decarboxylase
MDRPSVSARLQAPADSRGDLDAYRLPDGRPLALFQLLAHCPPALADLRGATARALEATTMPLRPREILILRILVLQDAEAEVQSHVALFADRAGIADAELEELSEPVPRGFGPEDQLMIEIADAINAGGAIVDELWSRLVERFETAGAVEAVFIAAQYLKVAVLNNALRVIPPFPRVRDARAGRASG